MLFNTLILELGDCTMSILPKTTTTIDFANMKLFSAPKREFRPDTLYFANWSDFASYPVLPEINAVIYDDRPARETSDLEYLSTLAGGLIFSDKDEYADCFNLFEQCFLNAYRMEEHVRHISTTVYENMDIQELANQIATMYAHPMNIVNNAFSVLASSNNYVFFSQDLVDDIQSGHVPPQILRQLNIASQRQRTTGTRTVVIDHIGGQFHNYFTPILFNGVALGYFSVFLRPGEVMSAMERGYLARIAELLGVYLQRGNYTGSNRGSYYTSLLSTLLSENKELHNIEEERFQVFGFQVKKYKYIIYADTTQESPDDYFMGDLSHSITNILGNCIYAVQRNHLIFLASYDSVEVVDEFVHSLENLLLSTPFVHIGISSPFTILSEARGHYLEAQAAIAAGEQFHSSSHVLLYDNYRLMHMVQTLGQHTDVKLFTLPQLRLLSDYDKEHSSELLYTLYIYIHGVKDLVHTCEALHIHRNTLYFRLNKIKELTQLDFENAETLAMILISFTIMQLQNEIDWAIEK